MRSLSSLLLLLLLLQPTSAIAQSIVDTGDVVVDADNQLIVGSTAPGSRLIDGADDGPYSNIDIAPTFFFPTPSSIVVDNGGSLTSLGDLSLSVSSQTNTDAGFAELMILNESRVETNRLLTGDFYNSGSGGISIRIESGSTLHSSSADIFSSAGSAGFSVSVVGPGSSWINDGSVYPGGLGTTVISIEDGGYARFGSYSGGSLLTPSTLAVTGPGSIIDTGDMDLASHGLTPDHSRHTVEILDGGLMNSGSVWINSRTHTTALVQGDGSQWNIDGELHLFFDEGSNRVSILDGGSVYSRSASISSLSSVELAGSGSRWIVDGSVSVDGALEGYSAIDVTDGAWMSVKDDLTIGTNSQLNLDSGVVFTNELQLQEGELRGSGIIDGRVVNNGTIAPGDSATGDIGGIVIKGDYTQSDGASLNIQLGGTEPHLQSDILVVLGTSVLDGELNITLAEGYLPEHGDTFYVVAAQQLLGEFSFVSGLDLGDDLSFDVFYSDHFVALMTVDANWVAPPVPEPGAALLFAVGFFVVHRATRRRPTSSLRPRA